MNNYEDMDGLKIPPNAVTAEQAVIGGILINPSTLSDVSEMIDHADFYRSGHAMIFNEMALISDRGEVVDVISLSESLSGKDLLEQAGGFQYLVGLAKDTSGINNIKHYAYIIKDKARQRKLLATANEIAELAYSTELSTEEKISEAQAALMSMETHSGEEAAQANSAIKSVIDEIDLRFNSKGTIGLQTGFKDIDNKIGGIRDQNLMIIAARPAMGKTTFAMNIAANVVKQGNPVLVFSAEMSREELMEKMFASVGNLSFARIRSGKLENDDWPKLSSAVSILKDSPLYIDDRGGLTISQIRSSARKQKRKHGIKLIIVDYLQLLSAGGNSREQEVSAISRGLKALAKELNLPVIALSQLSRKCEERKDKRPMSSDLRDSGAIEQDADIVAFIYRDEVYEENTDRKGIAEIIFTKARGFETGTVCLASRLDVSRFDDLAHEPPPISQSNIKGKGGFSYD